MRLLLYAGIAATVAGLIFWILAFSIHSGGGIQIHGIGIVVIGPVPIVISGDSPAELILPLLAAILAIIIALATMHTRTRMRGPDRA